MFKKSILAITILFCFMAFFVSPDSGSADIAREVGSGDTQAVWGSDTGTTDIMLQAFHWQCLNNGVHGEWYDLISSKAADLEEAKIKMVWYPPVSKTGRQAMYNDGSYQHNDPYSACGYVPMDYYDLGEYRQWVQDGWPEYSGNWYQHSVVDDSGTGTETMYGSKAELISSINTLHGRGIKCIADIVINHRGPRQQNSCGEWISWGDDSGQVASGQMVWGHYYDCAPGEIASGDGGAGTDDGGNAFSPNLSHLNYNVKQGIKEWLGWMKNTIGFDGWRYDYVKGYAAWHIGDYNDTTNPYFSVGENWDGNTQTLYDWIDNTHSTVAKRSTAFDFPMKTHLTAVFNGTKSFSLLKDWQYANCTITGGWAAKSVTFLDNHDTYPNHANDPFPTAIKQLLQGYAFILTHPGTPCVFWWHYYDQGPAVHAEIKALCQIRVDYGITNTSSVTFLKTDSDCYAVRINGNVIVKIGDESWNPGAGWTLNTSGDGYAVWTIQ